MIRSNYSSDRNTQENFNDDEKYSETGESAFSRDSTIPFDQDEVLSERHYNMSELENRSRGQIRRREERPSTGRQSFRGIGPKGYRRSDEKIKDDVSECLYRNTEVDASYIEVFVQDGHVVLRGTVNDRYQKIMAEEAVEHLAGVIDVYNELRIKQTLDPKKVGKHGLIDNITGMN